VRFGVFHKILERFGQLGADEVQTYLHRLARDQRVLEEIFNAIREGILVVDGEGLLQYYNPAAEKMLGLGGGALGGKLNKYVKGLDWAALSRMNAVASCNLEVTYPQKRYINIYTIPLPADKGSKQGCALILHDATENREAVHAAAESERVHALTELAASVAHELGNPLNSFTIQLQLMDRELAKMKDDKLKRLGDAVKISRNEITRLDVILKQFLRALRPVPPTLRLGAVNSPVEDAVRFLEPEIKDRELGLQIDLDDRLPFVLLDADQIKQVIFNLIKNAIHATRAGGRLKIQTLSDQGSVLIVVADTGMGMTKGTMQRLFEPYYTTKQGGTGLGLIIARRIARDHGGELEVESEQGVGTTVRVRLPMPGSKVKFLENSTPV